MNALTGAAWMIYDHYLTVQPWEANFRPDNALIEKAAMWVRLPKLPLEYYDDEALTIIGNMIGKTIRVDLNTSCQLQGHFARICVLVELGDEVVMEVVERAKSEVVQQGKRRVEKCTREVLGVKADSAPLLIMMGEDVIPEGHVVLDDEMIGVENNNEVAKPILRIMMDDNKPHDLGEQNPMDSEFTEQSPIATHDPSLVVTCGLCSCSNEDYEVPMVPETLL
ncbi:hypothetical protein K1719_021342 [Acacia pycnantha]|nr:hypothetical protein K1719_021342 [Acacia pycnantha]